jgi:alpha-tubulin suppressor-like RCC1 family protein
VGDDGQLAQPSITKSLTSSGNLYIEYAPKLVRAFGLDMSAAAGGLAALGCGQAHSAAASSAGGLWTWGNAESGRLGHGDEAGAATGSGPEGCEAMPRRVNALAGVEVVSVACGDFHTLALDSEGRVFSWGWGGSFFSGGGALGHGDTDDVPTPALVEALEGTRVVQIASGGQHGAALDAEGGVWIWGCGEYGVMGDTGASDELAPVRCEFFDDEDGGAHIDVVQVACGHAFTLALGADGTVYAWGRNDAGQLGTAGSMSVDVYAMEAYPVEVRR